MREAEDSRRTARRLPGRMLTGRNLFASLILVLFIVAALLPTRALPHDPSRQNLRDRLVPPVWVKGGDPQYVLGTDSLGRDLFSRLIRGARATLIITLISASLAALAGSALGLLAGFYGSWIDEAISRLIDVQLAFPSMLLLISVVGLFGQNTVVLVFTLALAIWPAYARLLRGNVLSVRNAEYVDASRALGSSDVALMVRHIAPNTMATMIVFTSFQLSGILLIESALSFLGLGVPPPDVSWGSIIAGGRAYLLEGWWVAAVPGLAISLVVLAFNFLGDGLRDVLDPRER